MIISIRTHVAADIKIFVNIFFNSPRFFKISRFKDIHNQTIIACVFLCFRHEF